MFFVGNTTINKVYLILSYLILSSGYQRDCTEERPQLAHFTEASQHLWPHYVVQSSFWLGGHKFPARRPDSDPLRVAAILFSSHAPSTNPALTVPPRYQLLSPTCTSFTDLFPLVSNVLFTPVYCAPLPCLITRQTVLQALSLLKFWSSEIPWNIQPKQIVYYFTYC